MMRSKDGQTVTLTRSAVIAIVLVSVLIVAVAGGIVYAVLSNQNQFSSHGRIVARANLWIKNNGRIPTTLSLSLGDWVPLIAQQYMTLTWNYNGQTLQPNASVPVILAFSVNLLITGVGDFYFNIYVISTQA